MQSNKAETQRYGDKKSTKHSQPRRVGCIGKIRHLLTVIHNNLSNTLRYGGCVNLRNSFRAFWDAKKNISLLKTGNGKR